MTAFRLLMLFQQLHKKVSPEWFLVSTYFPSWHTSIPKWQTSPLPSSGTLQL